MLNCPSCGRASPADASFCAGCGTPLGATATAREVRKTVTALFCDLVGSTTLGEQHDPEVLRSALEAYFDLVRSTVERHGGRVEKFIGDAVNAVFGLPAAHEDDALRAVRAGMEIQAGLADLAVASPVPLAARVGITTGEVLAPGTGRPLIGDAMNTAARLQTGGQPGHVVIGEPTWRLVQDAVVAEPIPPLAAKGKADPLPAWRVLAVASSSPMRARRMDAPMVGRAREAAALRTAFERAACDRTCELFTVLGVAGAGKSRLVEEFLATLDPGVEILRGRCLSYGEGITWYPVTEALRAALGIAEFAEVEAVRAAIAAAVASEEHAVALEASLAALFAAGPGSSAEEISWAVRRFLESRGRERPLVVVLDDIHWGEPAFLDLVEHLADWSRDASILLLAMARPDLLDVRPAWGGGKTNAATISLAPLTAAETDALVDGLLGATAVPAGLRSRIASVAEGNPLFVEELLRMLVDDGRLVREDGTWTAAGDLADVAVPPTVSALLSARLDRLSEGERSVLEAAAVAGKDFHRGAVEALLTEPARPDLPVHLRSLVRKELVTPERSGIPGQDAYRFRHLLIRDAAYDAIPKTARAGLHVAFAGWLEGVAGDRIAEQQEILGYHLERAYRYRDELGLPDDRELRLRAGRALGMAGARALGTGSVRSAIEQLLPAADLTEGDPVQLEVLDDLATAFGLAGDRDAEGRTTSRLATAAERYRDPVFMMRARFVAYARETAGGEVPWNLGESAAFLEEAADLFRAHGADRFLAAALIWQASVAWERGDSAALVDRAREALDLSGGSDVAIGQCVNGITEGLAQGPQPLSAAIAEADAFLASLAGHRFVEAVATINRAGYWALTGRAGHARSDMARGREIVADFGGADWPSFITFNSGMLAWLEDDLDGAEAALRDAIAATEAAGLGFNIVFPAHPLARILLDRGRDDEAEPIVRRLDERFGRTRGISAVPGISLGSLLAARKGDRVEALRLSDDALGLAGSMDFLILQADVALDRAEVLLLAGRRNESRASAEDALERYERKEHAIGIRRATAFIQRLEADGADLSRGADAARQVEAADGGAA